ncbi:MAG: hypothetical protein DME17_17215 [Candidatus Rokuibacteriota bacterium]|jgi:hypothetical protein|nr:MAG: hypothetical protein DME17_17215 [Candidatus Rokubacteria bacterium]
MTLDIVAVRGQVTWWTWVIRDAAGVAIEESKTQFRVIEDAKASGHARLAQLQAPRQRPGQD